MLERTSLGGTQTPVQDHVQSKSEKGEEARNPDANVKVCTLPKVGQFRPDPI